MTLPELILLREKYRKYPELLAEKPSTYMALINECIEIEERKMGIEEHDPVLEAKIQKWIAEGRIYEGPSMGMMS